MMSVTPHILDRERKPQKTEGKFEFNKYISGIGRDQNEAAFYRFIQFSGKKILVNNRLVHFIDKAPSRSRNLFLLVK